MKPILATIALLLLLGCQSKPKPDGAVYIYSGFAAKTAELPPEGFTWHVTREQWEAAQGLYVNVRISCDDTHYTDEGCREIIFDPSKAAK